MTFNSIEFVFFFVIAFTVYFLPIMKTATRQNTLLLAASYVFYGMWDWKFLGLILFTTATTFISGKLLMRNKSRLVAGINIVINIGILALFKYFNFFGENLSRLLSLTGWKVDWILIDIILPVGISFYTFQAIGYTIDVYRGDIKDDAGKNPIQFATFIAYFPQLVAGPIERAKNILPQLERVRTWKYEDSVEGLQRIIWGMMKKVVIADQCGVHTDIIWQQGLDVAHGEIKMFFAVLLFSIQIYCDFSGYCDIALGASRMLGIKLMENFKRPYFSRSVLEFWHRWHVSLMEWFQQYVYIPLGGSRVSRHKHYMNVITVFLISGLWHGASWCFILWGAYWAIAYITAIMLKVSAYKDDTEIKKCNIFGTICSMSVVITGWAIFRSTSISECMALLCKSVIPLTAATTFFCIVTIACMKQKTVRKAGVYIAAATVVAAFIILTDKVITYYYLLYATGMFACEWATRADTWHLYPLPRNKIMRYTLYIFIYMSIILAPSTDSAFIYFQF